MFFGHRTLVVVAGLLGLGLAAGCSSSSDGASAAPSKPVLSGQYTASGVGSITEVSFYDSSYSLWRSPCADGSGGATCLEEGTFAVNDDLTGLTLINGATGQSSTLPMQVLQVASKSDLAPESVIVDETWDDGLSPQDNGGSLAGGDGGALTTGNGALIATTSAPPALTVKAGNQTLTRTGPPPKCTFDKAVSGDPAAILAKAKAAGAQNGVTITGDTTHGTFSGKITGTYVVNGQTLHVELTAKPFLASCGLIQGKMGL